MIFDPFDKYFLFCMQFILLPFCRTEQKQQLKNAFIYLFFFWLMLHFMAPLENCWRFAFYLNFTTLATLYFLRLGFIFIGTCQLELTSKFYEITLFYVYRKGKFIFWNLVFNRFVDKPKLRRTSRSLTLVPRSSQLSNFIYILYVTIFSVKDWLNLLVDLIRFSFQRSPKRQKILSSFFFFFYKFYFQFCAG